MGRIARLRNKGVDPPLNVDGTPKIEKRGRKPGSGRPRKHASHAATPHATPQGNMTLPPNLRSPASSVESEEKINSVPSSASCEPSPSRPASPIAPFNDLHRERLYSVSDPMPSSRRPSGLPTRQSARLLKTLADIEADKGASRQARLQRFLAENPEGREMYRKYKDNHPRLPAMLTELENVTQDNGDILTIGDVIYVIDIDDGLRYFAQIRVLFTDLFARKFANLIWLSPKRSAKFPHEFDALHFAHTIVDHRSHPIEQLRYVCTRPNLPMYEAQPTARTIANKARLARLEARRKCIIRSATTEIAAGKEIMRAGDVKEAEEEDNGVMERVLAKAMSRAKERDREEDERMDREEKASMERAIKGDSDKAVGLSP